MVFHPQAERDANGKYISHPVGPLHIVLAEINQIKLVSKLVNSWSCPIICVQLVADSHCYDSVSYHTCQ
jgi:hypothetical protein